MADKTALNEAVARAEAITETGYCAPTWNALQTALNEAKNLGADAAQDVIDAKTAALNTAITNLKTHDFTGAWQSDADGHWHECTAEDCTAASTKEAHKPDREEATETEAKKCRICGFVIEDAAGHILPLVHRPAKDATEEAEGNIEYWECSGCGEKFKNETGTEKVTDVTIPKLTPAPTPVIPVTPSKPAQLPFNPNAGSNLSKFPFADVPSDSWYYSSVKAAWENGLIDGVTANEFKPNATLTVAQTIKLAAALHQLDRTGEVSLKNGGANWYDSYVNYAVVNGIIEKDYANYTKAQMNAPVTRGEFVHIFHGAEDAYKAINTVADNAIPDVKATDKFAAEIYEFYRAGILTGSDAKGTFHSVSTIKRSEAAAILLRMFEASARKGITLN